MRWLALFFVLATPADARDVALRTGDHEGFTRIVVEDPAMEQWNLGRNGDGYALRLTPPEAHYDLGKVYDLIRHNRLAAIGQDSDSSDLQLDLGCDCHAVAEEIRPGVVVIDLVDGAAPLGSEFEKPLVIGEAVRPRARPGRYQYDWSAPDPISPFPGLPLEDPALSKMRQSLLEQLSRGAASGAVEMTRPAPIINDTDVSVVEAPLQVQIGETPGFVPRATEAQPDLLTANGIDCIDDDRLDVGRWGTETPVAEALSAASAELTGEFDRPDPEAVKKAVRYYLFLGFGAEARQIIRSFDVSDSDRPLWEAIADILDGDTPQHPNVLKGMQECDTSASLWAVLGDPTLRSNKRPQPILRSFSGLPVHLRRHIGPRLAQHFLDAGDASSARAVRDATLRPPGAPSPQVSLMAAKLEIAEGNSAEGEKALKTLAVSSGPTGSEALVALAERTILDGGDIPPETVISLAALLEENDGAPLETRIRSTYRHALAASGDFDAAFALSEPDNSDDVLLWKTLVEKGSDSSMLAHSILPPDKPLPDLPAEVGQRISGRLLSLGFADEARRWVETGMDGSEAGRILAAQIALKQRDTPAALQAIAGLSSPEAASLRGQAALQNEDPTRAMTAFTGADDRAGQIRATRLAEDWQTIAKTDEGAWQAAAALALPPLADAVPPAPGANQSSSEAPVPGPLAQGRKVLAESASAREALTELLQKVSEGSF